MKKKNIGSSFDDYLKEDGIYEEVVASANEKLAEAGLRGAAAGEALRKTLVSDDHVCLHCKAALATVWMDGIHSKDVSTAEI